MQEDVCQARRGGSARTNGPPGTAPGLAADLMRQEPVAVLCKVFPMKYPHMCTHTGTLGTVQGNQGEQQATS